MREARRESISLESCSAELRLKIYEAPLDLDVKGLTGTLQDKVSSAAVGRADGLLELCMPSGMCDGNDGLRHCQLAGVAQ
jgi:hypothetical protein